MKIAFIINSRLVSGAEEHLLDLAGRMVLYGIEPVFMIRKGSQIEERLSATPFRSYPVYDPAAKMLFPVRIAQALVKEQPDVISVNREHNIYSSLVGFYLALPFLAKRPKLVNVFHTPTSRRYPLLATLFDGVIATSEYTGESFGAKNPGLDRKTSIIHYGIQLPVPQPDKGDRNRERRLLKGKRFPVIGMVGELWKNQAELIDAGVELVRVFPDITIAIVGGGEMEPLQEKIVSYGLERNIILTGRIPRAQIADLFYDFDLSVSTHRNEGFGIVHIESLAAGTPVVAYNSGGLVEILNKGGGVLVDGVTPDFVREVVSLLGDEDRCRMLASEGQRVVRDYFTLETMVKRHVDFYTRIAGKQVER